MEHVNLTKSGLVHIGDVYYDLKEQESLEIEIYLSSNKIGEEKILGKGLEQIAIRKLKDNLYLAVLSDGTVKVLDKIWVQQPRKIVKNPYDIPDKSQPTDSSLNPQTVPSVKVKDLEDKVSDIFNKVRYNLDKLKPLPIKIIHQGKIISEIRGDLNIQKNKMDSLENKIDCMLAL